MEVWGVHVWGCACVEVCMCGDVGKMCEVEQTLGMATLLAPLQKASFVVEDRCVVLCVRSRKTCSTSYRNSRTVDSP